MKGPLARPKLRPQVYSGITTARSGPIGHPRATRPGARALQREPRVAMNEIAVPKERPERLVKPARWM